MCSMSARSTAISLVTCVWRTLWHWRARKAAGRAGEQLGMRPLQRICSTHAAGPGAVLQAWHASGCCLCSSRTGRPKCVSVNRRAATAHSRCAQPLPHTRHGPIFGLRPRAEDPSADARPTSSRAEQVGGGSAAAPASSFTSVTTHPLSTPPSGQPPGSQTAHVPEISAMFDVGEPRRY